MTGRRFCVFLDRDGVIVENRVDHVKSREEVRFLPGAIAALRTLAASPAAIVIVSNQSAVARGLITLEQAWSVQHGIVDEIQGQGGRIDRSYLCPHLPRDGCTCRKPAPGMIREAARELRLNLDRSWLVGDALTDLQAAKAAGVRGVLVRTGRGAAEEWLLMKQIGPRWPVVADFAAAVQLILDRAGLFKA
jgi:D-glycero-D-manno-heptose 1,7-bisphosphate phosphatase